MPEPHTQTNPNEGEHVPGDTLWQCRDTSCGLYWIEDGEGDQEMPAYCGVCGSRMQVVGRLSEILSGSDTTVETTAGSRRYVVRETTDWVIEAGDEQAAIAAVEQQLPQAQPLESDYRIALELFDPTTTAQS